MVKVKRKIAFFLVFLLIFGIGFPNSTVNAKETGQSQPGGAGSRTENSGSGDSSQTGSGSQAGDGSGDSSQTGSGSSGSQTGGGSGDSSQTGGGSSSGSQAGGGSESSGGKEDTSQTGNGAGAETNGGTGTGGTSQTGNGAGTNGGSESGGKPDSELDKTNQSGENGTGSKDTAGDGASENKEGNQDGTESKAGTEDGSLADGSKAAGTRNIGQVDVWISSGLPLLRTVDFTVTLAGNGTGDKSAVISIGDTPEQKKVCFEGLAEGSYTLTVTGAGFAAYTQTISVEKSDCSVKLMTGFVQGITYEAGAAHPGVLLIGDADQDGIADETDARKLLDAIDGGQPEGITDLNGDGAVNLVDLEYYTRGLPENRDTLAKQEKFVPAAVITASADSGTKAEGNLNTFLRDGTGLRLSPANGGEISESNPVALTFDFAADSGAVTTDGIIIETGGDNPIGKAMVKVAYTDTDGTEQEVEVPVDGLQYLLKNENISVEEGKDGSIRIHLGSQIAVKKVTLIIKGMKKNNNLAEISTVEFVNGMEERIPEPEMDIPANLTAEAGNKSISLAWEPSVNVTGYEVLIQQEEQQQTMLVAGNALDLTSFGGKELVNYKEYRIRVQSVNGSWRSGYGNEVTAVPKPTGKPDKPDNVSAVGGFKSITVSWKNMKDTLSYNLYYKESSDSSYQKIENITGNSYTISGLKDLTEYMVYVTGVNELGESSPSLTCAVSTTDQNPAVMPRYNLINVGEAGQPGAHIISASTRGRMVDSPLDAQSGTAWGTVDHDPASYYWKENWDDGGYNALGQNGLIYEFDQAYQMDTIALEEVAPQNLAYFYAKACTWDENGVRSDWGNISIQKKTDQDGRPYYVLKLPKAASVKKIQIGLGRYLASGSITVSEVYFYYYDTLMDEIMGLYEDDLHMVLRPEVTQATIDALRAKVTAQDPVSGEYHPDRELLERELKTAEELLANGDLGAPVEIHTGITTNDVGRGFGGLNAWQPLGVAAAAEEEIMVYVGHNSKKTGETTNLQLVATQYHAESGSVSRNIGTLKIGANKVSIPKLWTVTGIESGGALYVQYTGSNASERYAVRVSGGGAVPRLDLYQVTDETERLARTKAYLEELQVYVTSMEAKHKELHQSSGNKQVKYDYDERNCVLGASDLLLDTMMLSLPAKQILNGAGGGSLEDKAQKVLHSMDAIEDMMYLFYQHKGLNQNAGNVLHQVPKGHLNIRYQRMFSGAFMYASGNHIGIEWPEAAGMMGGEPVVSDKEGRYESGRYFGWGISHEIGHCINQGAYAVAEITNNYYAQLAQARDSDQGMRFQYKNIYEKVTSGTKGRSGNLATQLGMYWQLHLAYDNGYNFKTYAEYGEQLEHLFYARVDTYAREPRMAPGKHALTLTGDKDQDLMRLCCAAAQRDILEFFERWGMTPTPETRDYAGQFEKETRAIYYGSDNARVYRLLGGKSSLGTEGTVVAVSDDTRAVVNENAANQVDFNLGFQNIPASDVLGYEIVRCTISGGEVCREPAGFATGTTFSDNISVMNNRTVFYEVTLVDKYLNRSAVKVLDGIKISHDGSMDKSFFTITTEHFTGTEEESGTTDEFSPCTPDTEHPAAAVIDGDVNTVYTAQAEENAEIVLEFHKTLTVAGLKYTAGNKDASGTYEVQVRTDGGWVKAAELTLSEKVNTVHFVNEDGKYISTYGADAIKLLRTEKGSASVSIAELDVLGVTGDNVEFLKTADSTGLIGVLSEAYRYGEKETDVIPAGSIVFTGAYKGNPAYNVVVLYDQNGEIVGGTDGDGNLKAQQIILADVPEAGNIQNVSAGTWIYWIEPNAQTEGIKKVRAELYRVNNAQTNEGQRLVSDSLFEEMPAVLPQIQLK